jgi:hypothetical protein
VALVLPLAPGADAAQAEYVRAIDVAGAAGLVLPAGAAPCVEGTGTFRHRGGLVPVCLAAVAVAACGAGRLGRVLGRRPPEWLGRRSYGIWPRHGPVLACVVNLAPYDAVSAPALLVDWCSRRTGCWGIRCCGSGRVGTPRRSPRGLRPRLALAAALTGAGVLGLGIFGATYAP